MQDMKKVNLIKIIFILCTLSIFSCSTMKVANTPKKISDFRPTLPGTNQENIVLDREEYKEKITVKGGVNSARMVEIFDRSKKSDKQVEYRILDVRPDSVYDLLGIKDLDVIIAASGYIVPSQTSFWQYLLLLSKLQNGSIEVRREGKPMLMNYTFEQ